MVRSIMTGKRGQGMSTFVDIFADVNREGAPQVEIRRAVAR